MAGEILMRGKTSSAEMKKADPTQISPLATWLDFARILPAKSAHLSGSAGSAGS
jgi:hypothetical protein